MCFTQAAPRYAEVLTQDSYGAGINEGAVVVDVDVLQLALKNCDRGTVKGDRRIRD